MNSIAVPRKAKAAAGALMKLSDPVKKKTIVTCVEYNYIDSLLKSTSQFPDGDVNDPQTGYSPFPGNVNQLIIRLDEYVRNLEEYKGNVVPDFVNPKYVDEKGDRSIFKSPTRLECMMQDYAKIACETESKQNSVGVTLFEDQDIIPNQLTHCLYAPAKNNMKDAKSKFDQGISDAGTGSSEMAIYALNCCMLKKYLGMKISGPRQREFGGIKYMEWPHVVISPSSAPSIALMLECFPQANDIHISERSTLVLDGAGVTIKKLHLDGTLIIKASNGARIG